MAFCLDSKEPLGPKIGFTTPRKLGVSVVRNRVRRRVRECVRRQLAGLGSSWEIVFNPRRTVLTAAIADLEREVKRIIERCIPS